MLFAQSNAMMRSSLKTSKETCFTLVGAAGVVASFASSVQAPPEGELNQTLLVAWLSATTIFWVLVPERLAQ
jgi:hypothetical protein